jgi:hypothetical protein
MKSQSHEVSALESRDDGQSLDKVVTVEDRPDSATAAGDIADMCATLFTMVDAGMKASRKERMTVARDRVIVPEVKVGDVIDAVEGLRPRILVAIAGACGSAADRLRAAQSAIRSKVG